MISDSTLRTEEVMVLANLISTTEDSMKDVFSAFKEALARYFIVVDIAMNLELFMTKWNNSHTKPTPDFQKPMSIPFLVAYTRPQAARNFQRLLKDLDRERAQVLRLDASENVDYMRRILRKQHNPKKYDVPIEAKKQQIGNHNKLYLGNGITIAFSNIRVCDFVLVKWICN